MRIIRSILAGLLVVFGLVTLGYCARVDESTLATTRTCADYAPGTAPADCVNAEDVERSDSTDAGLVTLGVVMVLAGLALGYVSMAKREREAIPPATLGRSPRDRGDYPPNHSHRYAFLPLPLLLDLRVSENGVSLFAALLILVVAVLWFTGWRNAAWDAGGYVDRWTSSDKAWHAGISFLLVLAGTVLFRVHPTTAAITVLIVGLLWECAQVVRSPHLADSPTGTRRGYFSVRDLAADAAGVVLAWLVLALFV